MDLTASPAKARSLVIVIVVWMGRVDIGVGVRLRRAVGPPGHLPQVRLETRARRAPAGCEHGNQEPLVLQYVDPLLTVRQRDKPLGVGHFF